MTRLNIQIWLAWGTLPVLVMGSVLIGVAANSYLTLREEALDDRSQPGGQIVYADEIQRLRLYMVVIGVLLVVLKIPVLVRWIMFMMKR